MRILAIPGSLRAASINAAVLRAASRLAPPGMVVGVFSGIGELPLFNPDLEVQLPPRVHSFRERVAAADALLIASPEYAHGVSGVIKNALDWLVSYEPFVNKPVAVLNTSPRACHADAALREILRTMSAHLVEDASIPLPLLGSGLDESAMVAAPEIVAALDEVFLAMQAAVDQRSDAAAEFALV